LTKRVSNERHRQVRSWIMQTPRPASLRVTTDERQRETVVCGSGTWGDVASTVLALNPETIEALDSSGNVLRATSALDLFESEPDERHGTIPAPPPAPATSAPRPSIAELVGDDPESRRFALFAHLLSDAYRHANDIAFAKLADITQQQADRAASLERSVDAFVENERLRVEVARSELEARRRELDEQEDDDDDGESKGAVHEAIDKIAKHVAKAVGADDDGAGDDDEDDDEPEHAPAPNGAGGH